MNHDRDKDSAKPPAALGGDDVAFEVPEDAFGLVLDASGRPRNGEELVEVVHVSPAIHSPYGARDIRVFAHCRVVRTGQTALKVWYMRCGGCGRDTGLRCTKPMLKPGASGRLRREAVIMLGRALTARERLSVRQMFLGRRFRAVVRPVLCDSDGRALEDGARYSVVDEVVGTRGTSTPTLSDSSTSTSTTTHTTSTGKGASDSVIRPFSRGRLKTDGLA